MSQGNKNQCLRFNDNISSGMHRGHNGHPGPSSDHLSERGLGQCLAYFPNCRVTRLRVRLMLRVYYKVRRHRSTRESVSEKFRVGPKSVRINPEGVPECEILNKVIFNIN